MHISIKASLLSLLLSAPISAIPFDPSTLESRAGAGAYCSYPSTFVASNSEVVYGAPELVTGDFVGPGPTGASIAAGYSYSKTWSYTGGVSGTFNFGKVFSLTSSASVGVAVTKGTSISASVNCPPNVVCGLIALPQVMRVTGFQTMHHCGSNIGYDTNFPCTADPPTWCPTAVWNVTTETQVPYTADFPIVIKSSTVAGQDSLAVDYRACTVGKGVTGLDPCPSKVGPASAGSR